MSTLKSELSEKIGEARGLLSNLIFGKKQKKPKEMIETIRVYLNYLNTLQQQQQLAGSTLTSPNAVGTSTITSPNSSGAPVSAATVTSPAYGVTSPPPTNTNSSSTTTNTSSTTASTTTPTINTAPTTASNPSQLANLTIPSPANGSVVQLGENVAPGNLTSPPQSATGAQPSPPFSSPTSTEFPLSITSDLDQIVTLLYGDSSGDSSSSGSQPDLKAAKEVIDLMFEFDLFRRLLENIRSLEFEARKFFTRIFEYALTQRRELSVPYILARRYIILRLICAYEEKDVSIALACDAILRACIQCEPISEMILSSGGATGTVDTASVCSPCSSPNGPTEDMANVDMVLPFFRYLDLPTFINSHAFATFKLLLQLYPALGAQYLAKNYNVFFSNFNKLLASENYLTKVQSFAFLGEILMERLNQEIMMKYVNESDNLKLAMMALRGPKAIQLAVFNVLKVFVPNPYKADAIVRILTQNKKNFLAFLAEFERESEDEVLIAHKQEMVAALEELPDVAPPIKKMSAGSSEEAVVNNAAQQQQAAQVTRKDSLP